MAFQLKAVAFPPNGRIREVQTCEGEDVPPPLVWSAAPAGTKSFALIVNDSDAPRGTFCHWAIFDVAPTVTSVSDEIPIGAHETVNDFGRMGYGGPCPQPWPPAPLPVPPDGAPRESARPSAAREVSRRATRRRPPQAGGINVHGNVCPLGVCRQGSTPGQSSDGYLWEPWKRANTPFR